MEKSTTQVLTCHQSSFGKYQVLALCNDAVNVRQLGRQSNLEFIFVLEVESTPKVHNRTPSPWRTADGSIRNSGRARQNFRPPHMFTWESNMDNDDKGAITRLYHVLLQSGAIFSSALKGDS